MAIPPTGGVGGAASGSANMNDLSAREKKELEAGLEGFMFLQGQDLVMEFQEEMEEDEEEEN